MNSECANSFRQIYLYEGTEYDETLSAVFIRPGQYYVEVRVTDTRGWVIQADSVNVFRDRVSCLPNGEILLEFPFTSREESFKYFWSFVNNPEMGIMEATL